MPTTMQILRLFQQELKGIWSLGTAQHSLHVAPAPCPEHLEPQPGKQHQATTHHSFSYSLMVVTEALKKPQELYL